ncbi:hypothetical protein U9M48_021983 [Paspalum notatum var. saurae]|uniref:Protein NRT1/ PTR FAMILY 1.2 n=1 Tax=Paspalum notatum var. saurae TaxID=547442 RepID=A0AAQ3TK81_PASNO
MPLDGKIARNPLAEYFLTVRYRGGASIEFGFGSMEGVHEEQQHAHVLGENGGLRLVPVIFANEVSERIVSASVGANLIIYLTTKYHLGAASSAIIIFVYIAAANFLPVCGAIVSDALLGRYLMVTLTLFSCTISLDVRNNPFVLDISDSTLDAAGLHPSNSKPRLQFAYPGSATCAVCLPGSHGARSERRPAVRPCGLAVAEDQIAHWNKANKDHALRGLFSWYYVSVGFSQIVAVTVLVYFQDKMGWKVGFAVSAAIMASVTLLNLAASPFYVKVKPQMSMWAGLMMQHEVTEHLHSGASNLKSALSVMPMWSAMVLGVLLQTSSFGVLQAASMNLRIGMTRFEIPAASISIFEIMTYTVWSGCYDSYIVPVLPGSAERVLTLKQRMGIAVFLAVASMAVASVVEARRREAAAAAGHGSSPPMSLLWLAPQYVLMGLSGAFVAIAQIEFYYAVLPKSMGSFVLALLFLGGGVASILATVIVKLVNVVTGRGGRAPWISDNLNRGRYDCYYRLLAVLWCHRPRLPRHCAYVFHETAQNTSLEAGAHDEAEEMAEFRG